MWVWIGTAAVDGGPWAIVSFVVLQIVRGRLIPRSAHLDRVSDLKATIAAQEATIVEKDRQIGVLLGRPSP